MAKYTVWIGCGDTPWGRTYFNELGAVQLTQEQVDKYFTFTEDDEIEFDSELIAEATDRDYDDSKNDFPTWDTITDGCICWGPCVEDQNIGVHLSEDDENQIWINPIETLPYYSVEDIEEGALEEDEVEGATARLYCELDYPDGVWILYNSYERGGYTGEFEIPDDKEFDPKKLIVTISEVADNWNIVTGVEYDGECIDCEGDTTGKGIDWYVYYKGNLLSFK